MIFGDFDYLVIAGLGVDGLKVHQEFIVLSSDACMDWADFAFVGVQDVVMVTK